MWPDGTGNSLHTSQIKSFSNPAPRAVDFYLQDRTKVDEHAAIQDEVAALKAQEAEMMAQLLGLPPPAAVRPNPYDDLARPHTDLKHSHSSSKERKDKDKHKHKKHRRRDDSPERSRHRDSRDHSPRREEDAKSHSYSPPRHRPTEKLDRRDEFREQQSEDPRFPRREVHSPPLRDELRKRYRDTSGDAEPSSSKRPKYREEE